MGDHINKFRFFIPPVFLIFSVYWLYPEWSSQILDKFSSRSGVDTLTVLIGGSLLVLAVGLVISSLGAFIINLFSWTISKKARKNIHTPWKWFCSFGDQTKIAEIEFKNWDNVSKDDSTYTRDQMDKRWQMFVVNINMCVTLFLIVPFWIFSKQHFGLTFSSILVAIWFLLVGIFMFNSRSAYTSVHALDECAENKKTTVKNT
jgi:hypothetical protein